MKKIDKSLYYFGSQIIWDFYIYQTKMSFDIKDLDHICKLCSIWIDDSEKQKYLSQIDDILGYISQLQEVDVEWIEPLTHPLENKFIEPRTWVKDFEDRQNFIKFNVKHPVKDNAIVIKSPIKS